MLGEHSEGQVVGMLVFVPSRAHWPMLGHIPVLLAECQV